MDFAAKEVEVKVGARQLVVRLLRHTPHPENTVAASAHLCYSPAGVHEIEGHLTPERREDLIALLLRSGHHTPLEHAVFTFGVEGISRACLAQLTRHRIASFSVQSQRWVGKTSAGSTDGVFDYIVPPRIAELGPEYVAEFERQMRQIQEWYDFWYRTLGATREAREDARFVLPNAAETKLVVTMNARELHHFFSLRCCNRAQWEIRNLAEAMLRLVKGVAPALFRNAGPRCLRGPCPEGKLGCGKAAEVRARYGVDAADG